MAFHVFILSFILWRPLSDACIISVTQNAPVLVAFRHSDYILKCDITISSSDPQKVECSVQRDEEQLSVISKEKAANESFEHHIKVGQRSATYYCTGTCAGTSMRASRGTYIHVRESGYVEPASESTKLQSGLITLFVLLVLLSGAGSYLLLHPVIWKDQGTQFRAPRTFPNAVPNNENADSLYTDLQNHSNDVYNVLDDDSLKVKPQDQTCHVHVHDVISQSPTRKPKPGIKPQTENKEKMQRGTEKPPLAKKPQQKMRPQRSEESAVYENVHR